MKFEKGACSIFFLGGGVNVGLIKIRGRGASLKMRGGGIRTCGDSDKFNILLLHKKNKISCQIISIYFRQIRSPHSMLFVKSPYVKAKASLRASGPGKE